MRSSILPAVKGILVRQGQVLLVRRSMQDISGPGLWEFPGGKIDFGETPEAALVREVWEETGLRVEAGPLLYTAAPVVGPGRQLLLLHYLCAAPQGAVRLSEEHEDALWAGKARLREVLNPGALRDMERNDVFERLTDLAQ